MKTSTRRIVALTCIPEPNERAGCFQQGLAAITFYRRSAPAAIVILLLMAWYAFVPQAAAQGTPGFVPVGNLNVARFYHTATLLTDGRVLVAGGDPDPYGSSERLASTELYDPASHTFLLSKNLNNPREAHTATLLRDGRVLIAGGAALGVYWNSAELFDPLSGSFTPTAPMSGAHAGHTATLLADGRVLIAGGESDSGTSVTAEIFDPATGQFSPTGSLNQPRLGAAATLLSDGRVLIAGGSSDRPGPHDLVTAEIYDPTTGQFQMLAGQMSYPGGPLAVRLPGGMVLLAGGQVQPGEAPGYSVNLAAEIFDPLTGIFSLTGTPLTGPRSQPSLTELPDGRALLLGGEAIDFASLTRNIFATAELYDPSQGQFASAGSLNQGCFGHTATLLADGSVLVAGGIGHGSQLLVALAQGELFRECLSTPGITSPGDVLVNTDPGLCQASHVFLGTPTGTDPCGVPTIRNDAPAVFQHGTTIVTWTATDPFGNTATCQQNVTVLDKEPPAITCPANISIGCSVNSLVPATFAVEATDNCDPAPVVTSSPASGAGFPVGTTTVNCTAVDASGNQSACSFTVTRAPLGFEGFLSPISGADATGGTSASPVRTFKMGSTIPVKFTASCAGSPVLTGVHTLQVAKYTGTTTSGTPIDATPQGAATTGDQFRLADSTAGQWQFNLDTTGTGMSIGVWRFIVTLSDGSQHVTWIQLK